MCLGGVGSATYRGLGGDCYCLSVMQVLADFALLRGRRPDNLGDGAGVADGAEGEWWSLTCHLSLSIVLGRLL